MGITTSDLSGSGNLIVSGSVINLGDSCTDAVTINAQLSASCNVWLSSDSAGLRFGAGKDVVFAHDGGTGMDITSAGALDIKSTADSEGCITIEADGGVDETISIHSDQGTGHGTDAASNASINLISDSGGIALSSGRNGGSAIKLVENGGTDGMINIHADTGLGRNSAGNASTASISIYSDGGGIGLYSGNDDTNAIRIEANGGDGETIVIHSNQGTGADSITLLSDEGGVTLTTALGVVLAGATPKLTIGDGGAEDTMLVFDGNAIDYRIGLDDAGTVDDVLEIGVGATHGTTPAIVINSSAQVQVQDSFAANVGGTFGTFADGDATPSVATGNIWKHHASSETITMFDDGVAGQIITVISTDDITYDVTGTNLKGGSDDIETANGDVTMWVFDGTNWYLMGFMDVSEDLSWAE